MFRAEFALSQPAGFEFHHQSVDLSATTPLPALTTSLSVMPTVHQKHACSTRWVRLTETVQTAFVYFGIAPVIVSYRVLWIDLDGFIVIDHCSVWIARLFYSPVTINEGFSD